MVKKAKKPKYWSNSNIFQTVAANITYRIFYY